MSLTPVTSKKDVSNEDSDFDPDHTTPSPKPNIPESPKNSVRARKEKFEANIENKDVKTITKERSKNSKSRKHEKEHTEKRTQIEPEEEKPNAENQTPDTNILSENDKFTILQNEMKKVQR